MQLVVPQSKQVSKQLSSDESVWKVRKISLPLLLCEYGQESFTTKSRKDICYPKRRHQQVEPTQATGPAIATCFNVLNVAFLHALAEDAGCKR